MDVFSIIIENHNFKGSKGYIAGVLSALTHRTPDILYVHENEIDTEFICEHCVGGCDVQAMSSDISFEDITSGRKLKKFVMELTELNLQDNSHKITLKSLISKRYVHLVYYTIIETGGFEKIENLCELYQCDDLEFIHGLKAAKKHFKLNMTHDVILDTTNYTHIKI